jgi:hypothetical protein
MMYLLPLDSNRRGNMKVRWSSWVRFASSLLVAGLLSPMANSDSLAFQVGSGSVTARVFVCPDALSMAAVLGSNDPSELLAYCDPSAGPNIAPKLREGPDGAPRPGEVFDEGVYVWPGLSFGSYEFDAADVPSGFGDRLITNGADVPAADQENGAVTIDRTVPHIERRFYFFAPDDLPMGTISLTLYRCPDADTLSPATCTLLTDPPDDHASLYKDLWTDGLRGVYTGGRTSWHGLPFGIYSIIYSDLLGPGEGAAIPELQCISPERCGFWLGPGAPSANLQLYIFPIPTGARDSDGDGFTDLQERAGGTDSADPSSPGSDRAHSRVDTDRDQLSDQDEALYGTDPQNPDTDGDSVNDGGEVTSGTDPTALPRTGTSEIGEDGTSPSTANGGAPDAEPRVADTNKD